MHLLPSAKVGIFLAACALILAIDYPWGDLRDHPHWTEIGRVPFVSPPIEAEDILGNFLLGTPVGLAASLTFRRAAIAAALVTLPVSLAGEAIQIYSHERFPSATDVACNVAGALAAALAGSAWRRHNRPKH
jgi:glycopeptide antibiotics resistance protein